MRQSWFWPGETGTYELLILPFTRALTFRNAVYIFVWRDHTGYPWPLYIGEAKDMWDRLSKHEKFDEALALRANEIHVLLCGYGEDRERIETDLRNRHWTPLNEQPTRAYPFTPANPFAPANPSPPVNPFPPAPTSPFSLDALAALGAEPTFPFASGLKPFPGDAAPASPLLEYAAALRELAYPAPASLPYADAIRGLMDPTRR